MVLVIEQTMVTVERIDGKGVEIEVSEDHFAQVLSKQGWVAKVFKEVAKEPVKVVKPVKKATRKTKTIIGD